MNTLKSRKQLLLAESELNRAQMLHELRIIGGEVQALANQAKTVASIAAAVSLVAGLSSFRHKKSAPAAEKASWWVTILKGVGMVRSFWSSVHPPSPGPED